MSTRTLELRTENSSGNIFYMMCFLTCFVAAAIVSQVYSGIAPTMDHSPLDYFTGGALWMASAVCLIMATAYTRTLWKTMFWLAGCVALSLLAIDEFMGIHEATEMVVGDDDHSKVALWACTPIALFLIHRVERLTPAIAMVFALGFLLQTTYLTVDVGDGDYFTLPFELTTLQWVEDICELLFVCTYLFGFFMMLSRETLSSKIPLVLADRRAD